jgi:hypothetical protein
MKLIAYAHLCFVSDVYGVQANTSCFCYSYWLYRWQNTLVRRELGVAEIEE